MIEPQSFEALLQGDEQAFRALIRRHHANMIAVAMRYVRERAAAEDVVQETWMAVFRGVAKLRDPAAVVGWIYAILVNKARTRGKRDRRTLTFSDLDADGGPSQPAVSPDRFAANGRWSNPPLPWDDIDPERIVGGRQIWAHLGAAIEALPPAQRAVIVMREIEGQDAASTCDLLGLSEANQRVLLHRARARLRQALEDIVAMKGDAPAADKT
ncbi:MAG: sigma-70 family RNA polymerase sigma factor [Methylocystis sp.]|nr:sigma-70 family RNA polymerase sigma factor [Methylocystis sp.]